MINSNCAMRLIQTRCRADSCCIRWHSWSSPTCTVHSLQSHNKTKCSTDVGHSDKAYKVNISVHWKYTTASHTE